MMLTHLISSGVRQMGTTGLNIPDPGFVWLSNARVA